MANSGFWGRLQELGVGCGIEICVAVVKADVVTEVEMENEGVADDAELELETDKLSKVVLDSTRLDVDMLEAELDDAVMLVEDALTVEVWLKDMLSDAN